MSAEIQKFVDSLRSIDDPENNEYLQDELRKLVEPLKGPSRIDEVVVPIFNLFETYPNADFGTPGPLVHLLERYPGAYETELKASLHRRPSPHPIWMANRILNSNLSPSDRKNWMNLLQEVLTHPDATESARADTESFIEHQKKTGS